MSYFREPTGQESHSSKAVRVNDERDLAENFVITFVNLHNSNIIEILCRELEVNLYFPVQNIPNILLAHTQTTSIFAFSFLNFFTDNFLAFVGSFPPFLIIRGAIYFLFSRFQNGSTLVFRENEIIIKVLLNLCKHLEFDFLHS
ncbi:LOW QUALITY PROTEIN: hypothetical protein MXB_1434 [Myxobolus squamalis]|nr:LOW QUALITY PROTEIN: hypothetical protein MXB_1434 [Myxobolus squamalis]